MKDTLDRSDLKSINLRLAKRAEDCIEVVKHKKSGTAPYQIKDHGVKNRSTYAGIEHAIFVENSQVTQ